jgi:uncharacterized phage protein (TIGR02216 family)
LRAAAGAERAFPWDEIMAFGFGRLRLSSEQFWAMTPREMAAAMAAVLPRREAAPGRTALDALMARFPDVAERKATWPRK